MRMNVRLTMSPRSPLRKPTNLSLDAHLLKQARSLGVNLSQAADAGLRHAIAKAQAERWQMENAEAVASSNVFVETHGLPLERFRQF